MRTAREIMHTPAPSVSPDMTAKELHQFLLDHDLDGACLVEGERLVGVVTSMDLIFREKKVHMPTFFYFLDAVIPLGDPRRTYDEVLKIAGARVGDLATRELIVIGPETPLDEIATRMVEDHLTVLPVVSHDRLVGMVTKDDVLRATFG